LTPPTARYGLTTLTCVVIASMIGAGVFTTSGFALADLGSPQRVLLAWILGGVIALCGAVAYGELARRHPLSGGEYLYLSRRLHPFAGFLTGWVSLIAGFSGAIAVAALTCEAYLLSDASRPGWLPENTIAATLILLFGLGHAWLVTPVARVQNTLVIGKLILLTVFLIFALPRLTGDRASWQPGSGLPSLSSLTFLKTFATSIMWISLSYLGFNAAVYVASEATSPQRTVPRSMWLGTLIVTVFYLLLNFVFVAAAPVDQLMGKEDIAAVAAQAVGGAFTERVIRAAVVLGTTTSVAGMIMTGPRVFSRMADDGLFLSAFRSGPQCVPRTVMLVTVISLVMVFASGIRGLIGYLSTLLTLSSAVTVATLLLPVSAGAGKSPDESGVTRRTTVATVAALLYCLATTVVAVLMAIHDPHDILGAAITVAIGTVLWFARRVQQLGQATDSPRH
jgi:APA family basic amino acid/polyamine antiporter